MYKAWSVQGNEQALVETKVGFRPITLNKRLRPASHQDKVRKQQSRQEDFDFLRIIF